MLDRAVAVVQPPPGVFSQRSSAHRDGGFCDDRDRRRSAALNRRAWRSIRFVEPPSESNAAMIRFLLRFLGLLCLALGFILLVYDGTKWIADQRWHVTKVSDVWDLVQSSPAK